MGWHSWFCLHLFHRSPPYLVDSSSLWVLRSMRCEL
jgi:hypothetical protein